MRIMIVDDEAAHAEAIRRSLEAAGMGAEIQVAGTLREYREGVALHPPDIVLMDLNLPDGRAVEVLEQQTQPGLFPVLVMTSYGSEQVAVEVIKSGALDYMVKSPEAFADVPHTVERALREWGLLCERKRAEEALRVSEERFRSIFEGSPMGMGISTLDGRLLRANQAFCQLLGYTEEELLRMRFYDFTHPEDREMNAEEMGRLILSEIDAVHLEKRYLRKDGGIVWASVHAGVVRDGAGAPLFLSGQVLNVTERREAEAKIEHLNRVLRAIRNVSQLIVKEKGPHRLIQEICRLLVEARGYQGALILLTNEDGSSRDYAEAGIGEAFPLLAEDLRKGILPPCCMEAGLHEGVHVVSERSVACASCPLADRFPFGDSLSIELRHDTASYGYMVVILSQRLGSDEEEQSLFAELGGDVAFALHNIEREEAVRRSQEARSRAEAQLRQAQKMEALGTLAGGVAHDFNNILAIITGYTEMACWDTEENSPMHHNLHQVLKAAGRAKDLVQQILAFSRRSEQERKPVQIGLIVHEALKMLRASLPSTIEIQSRVSTKAAALADPSQIHQVLMNLCSNAAHAMRDNGGVLEVCLDDLDLAPEAILPHSGLQPGPHVRLTVSDTGQGITPAVLDRIFDPFFTTKAPGVGTGLGLAVVHGIVKGHGGAIEVESFPGKKTTFHVLLPAIQRDPETERSEITPLTRGQGRVLVVDDEPALVMVAKIMLERLGYEVECRTNSIEALQAFRHQLTERPFDLVITDMTMPHLTGEDLARELRRLQPDVPIILCTGFSEKINEEKARSLGIQGLLMKPFALRELSDLIRTVLGKRAQ